MRSPARGLWKEPDGGVEPDDVVMVEVQVEALDREWWDAYRRDLERRFQQRSILMRAIAVVTL